jgi:hypothetical protein
VSSSWAGALTTIAIIVIVAAGSLVWLQWRIDQDVETPVTVANPDGRTGKALLVYQPGLTNFQEKVVTAFTEGLVASGWRVSITTPSVRAHGN